MKILLSCLLVLTPVLSWAQANPIPGNRVPEPGMWALLGIAAAAVVVARFIGRK